MMTKNEQKKYDAERYKRRRVSVLKAVKKYRETHRKKLNDWMNQFRWQLKLDVLSHYGPNGKLQCSWPGCSVDDIDVLTLDHINNDGCKDRKNRPGPIQVYRHCRNAGYPEGYQTLCSNHNLKKEVLRRRELRLGQ
jgi:hypothetical protein